MAFSGRGALRRRDERDDFSIVRASRSGAWGARGLHACTAGLLPEASQGIGSSRRPHRYGRGHPALWRRAEPERALPHAGGRWGLRARAGRLAFLRSRQSAHRRGGRHPARCHSCANPAPTRAPGLVVERVRRAPRRTGGAAIARTLRRVRPSTGRHGTTRRCNGAPPRRRANGEARFPERSATSPPRWFRSSCQHLRPCQEPPEARAALPVSVAAAGRRRPFVLWVRWKRARAAQDAMAGWDEPHCSSAAGAPRKTRRTHSAPLRQPHRLSRRARAQCQVASRGRGLRAAAS